MRTGRLIRCCYFSGDTSKRRLVRQIVLKSLIYVSCRRGGGGGGRYDVWPSDVFTRIASFITTESRIKTSWFEYDQRVRIFNNFDFASLV